MSRSLRALALLAAVLAGGAPAAAEDALPLVVVRGDDTRILRSCRIALGAEWIADADGDGLIHIAADGVVVELGDARLRGAPAGAAPDGLSGCGIRVTGRNVVLRGGAISGFHVGVWASGADGLVVEDCDVSENYRQRLRSTPAAEDTQDWLWPHDNDADQWRTRYGAGIYVAESRGITVRRCRARRGQNGLCLRRVTDSRVYDNDLSFLSGWGLALFRCSRNVIDHNSFDFCIRGYSHGVYSRGQDSAGILCFEQCHDNLFAYNSATHGGDGFFGFAGKAALAGEGGPRGGCNRNLLVGNDLSYAAAIGIEMTFSFDNQLVGNRLVGGNYGVWGGYSQDTRAQANVIRANALAGIAVEHGWGWEISSNLFQGNRRGVELWWDEDADLFAKPWAKANGVRSGGHRVVRNAFRADAVGVELRGGTRQVLVCGNTWTGVAEPTRVDAQSELTRSGGGTPSALPNDPRLADLPGRRAAVGARAALAGREHIIVTEWGPYDWEAPYLQRVGDGPRGAHRYRLLGAEPLRMLRVAGRVSARQTAAPEAPHVVLEPLAPGVHPYVLEVATARGALRREGLLVATEWQVTCFASPCDPRTDPSAWRAAAATGTSLTLPRLRLPFAHGGPSQLANAPPELKDAGLPANGFGTLATTQLELPAGRWRLRTLSDDGVRVRVDGEVVIERWTHHGPTEDVALLERSAAGAVTIEVEHFELDGYAVLTLEVERAD